MIHADDTYSFLTETLPDLKQELIYAGDTACPYKVAAFFACYTKSLMRLGNTEGVRNCFVIAENFLRNGDYAVRNAIENVYIFSVTQALAFDDSFTTAFPLLFEQE